MDKGNLDDSVDNEGQLAEADIELEVKRMYHLIQVITFLDLNWILPQNQP